jgi:hypothetical protein
LKIKAGDDFDEFEFVMYDDVVKKFAPLACSELAKEVSLCPMYFRRYVPLFSYVVYIMFDAFTEWKL